MNLSVSDPFIDPGMRLIVCLCILLAALPSCGPPSESVPAPVRHSVEISSDEREVWEKGAEDLPKAGDGEGPSRAIALGGDFDVFSGIQDGAARRFLERGGYKPAVQFGCGRSPHPFEESLEDELQRGAGKNRLQALLLLMKARAPASVGHQWKALQELRQEPGAKKLLDEVETQFSEEVILGALEMAPPENRYTGDSLLEWYVRAAGVVRLHRALPTLIRLSRSENLASSLAAERSLEDFEGDEGDQALVQCLLGWQYDAYIRAGRALLGRNKRLLVEKLQGTLVPKNCRPWQAILLARADDAEAVPLLCETVTSVGIIDCEMFDHIERLAREQDLPVVRLLAARARETQQERADRLVEALSRKFPGR
jgi:hypothetical protein